MITDDDSLPLFGGFATPCEYRTVAELFGFGEATLCKLIREVCRGIKRLILRKYIFHMALNLNTHYLVLPIEECLFAWVLLRVHTSPSYQKICGKPRENPADYHNRKGWHSIILHGVVDHKMWQVTIQTGFFPLVNSLFTNHNLLHFVYSFTDVYIGWTGNFQ